MCSSCYQNRYSIILDSVEIHFTLLILHAVFPLKMLQLALEAAGGSPRELLAYDMRE